MMTKIKLTNGALRANDTLDGWVITSAEALVEDNEDMPLQRGDRINVNGDVYRGEEYIGNIS